MRSSASIIIAACAGLALVILLYNRSGHQPPEDAQPAVANNKPSARQQVARRLRQLDAAHDRTRRRRESAAGAPLDGKIEARAGVAPDPSRILTNRLPPRIGAPAAPSAPGPPAPDDGELDVDPDDIPGLKRIAVEDTDPERRLAAVTILGSSEDPAVLPTLAQALSDEDEEVRMAAIQSLSDFTGDAPIDLLSNVVVSDPSADNRYEALESLSDFGGERAMSAIQRALSDPDEDVRSLAESVLDMDDAYEGDSQAGAAPTPPPQQPAAP